MGLTVFNDDKVRVLCCEAALANNGLTYFDPNYPIVFTEYELLNGKSFGYSKHIYNNNIDYDNYVRVCSNTDKILIPTKERAIVESIKFKDYCDEGILIEAIKNYLGSFKNFVELYKVAQFYNVDKYEIDYWIKEAEEYDMEG